MKTIQLVTLALFISLTSLTNAQEKQNDATWEQTIKVINNNKSKIYGESQVYPTLKGFIFNLDSETLELIFLSDGYYTTVTFPLDQIEKVGSTSPQTFLEFVWRPGSRKKFIGTYDKNGTKEPEYDVNEHMWILYIEDDPNGKITDAFKHLAYLAGEKRKLNKF